MKYDLRNIEIIDEVKIGRLISANIYNTDDFIEAANTETKRKLLAQKTEISLNEIDVIASVSDLVRIKGVGVKTAIKLINCCNLKNVQSIAQYCQPRINTEKLSTPQLKKILKDCPISKSQFLEIAEEASELKPRLVFENNSEEKELNKKFKAQLRKQITSSKKWETKTLFIVFSFVFLTVLILLSISLYPLYQNYKIIAETYSKIIEVELVMSAFWLQIFHFIGIVLIFIIIVVVFLALWQILQKWYKQIIYGLLFKRYIFQDVYIEHNYLNLITRHKKNSKHLLFFAIIFFVSVILILIISDFKDINNLKIPVFLLLLFSIIILYKSTIKFYVGLKKLRETAKEVYQRIQFASQLETLFTVVVFIIALNIVFPLSIDTIQGFEQNYVVKLKQKKYQETLQQINFEKLDSDLIQSVKETVKGIYLINLSIDYNGNGMSTLKTILNEVSVIIKSLMWAFIIAFLLSFSIPYFSFIGFRSGITFLFIIGVSIVANLIIEKHFGLWFYIEESQRMRYLFIFIFSFWFAVLFDWLYSILSFNKLECSNCKNLMDKNSNYCPNCGLINS